MILRYRRLGILAVAVLLVVAMSHSFAAATTKVTIATYSQPRYNILTEDLLPRLQAKLPDIEIEVLIYPDFFDKMLVLLSTDGAPDIIDTAATQLFAHVLYEGAVDLAPFLERDDEVTMDDFVPFGLDQMRWPQPDGAAIYALPYDIIGSVLYYNKDLFSGAGVAFPDEAWTWDDLREAARRIAKDTDGDGENDVWGFSPNETYWLYDGVVEAYGGAVLTPDRRAAALEGEEAEAATTFLTELIFEDRSSRLGIGMAGGRLGMYIHNSGGVQGVVGSQIDWGVAMVPQGPVKRSMYGASNAWEVLRRPNQDMDAVWRVMKELLSDETIRAFWQGYPTPFSLSPRYSIMANVEPNDLQQVLLQSTPYMSAYTSTPNFGIWENAKRAEIRKVLEGQVSVREGLQRATQAINVILREAYLD